MQLITNGGFELGTLEPGWRIVPGSPEFDGGVTTAQAHSGTHSLELGAIDIVEQSFETYFQAHASSDLSFWIKPSTVNLRGPLYCVIEYADDTSNRVLLTPYASEEDWCKVSIPVDASKSLKRIQFVAGETVPYFIDDVSLEGNVIYRISEIFWRIINWFFRLFRG